MTMMVVMKMTIVATTMVVMKMTVVVTIIVMSDDDGGDE